MQKVRLQELSENVIGILERATIYRDKVIKFQKALVRNHPDRLLVSMLDDVFDQLNYAQKELGKIGMAEPAAIKDLRKVIVDLLQRRFKVIELYSENQLAAKLKPLKNKIVPSALKKIYKSLRKVHATEFRPERLDALLELQNVLNDSPKNKILTSLDDITREMIYIILNAETKAEVKEKLYIRSVLQKYKPDFITMPPEKSHIGALLRNLLKYELESDPKKKNAILSYEIIPRAMRHVPFERFNIPTKKIKYNPRRAFLWLLVGYFYEALKNGDIRAVNEINATKEFTKGKDILNERALESKRLYPYKKTKMLLCFGSHGYFKNKSLIASPFSTKGMRSTHTIPDSAMLVTKPDGSILADSASETRVHSSLGSLVYAGGYGQIKYGKIVEKGTDCGSFKTSEKNQLNDTHYFLSEGVIDFAEDPAFFVDHQYSPELAIYAKKYFPVAMNDNHSEFKINRYALNLPNAFLTEPNLDEPLQSKIPLVELMKQHDLLRQRLHDFAWLNRDDVRTQKLHNIICEMIRIELQKKGILIPRGYQIELFRRRNLALGFGYKIVKVPQYRVASNIENLYYQNIVRHAFIEGHKRPVLRNGRFPKFDLSYIPNTIYCRELERFLDSNEQIRGEYNEESFFTSIVYRNNAKRRSHQFFEKIIANRFIGMLSATIMLSVVSPIFYCVVFNILSPAIVFGIIGLSFISCALLNAVTSNRQKKEHSQEFIWGWETMFIAASLFFMVATFTFLTVSTLHIIGTMIAIGIIGFSLACLAIPAITSAAIKHYQTHNKKFHLVHSEKYRLRNPNLHNIERLDTCANSTFNILSHNERYQRFFPTPTRPPRPEANEPSAKKRLAF